MTKRNFAAAKRTFSSVLDVVALVAGKHRDGIAAVILTEAPHVRKHPHLGKSSEIKLKLKAQRKVSLIGGFSGKLSRQLEAEVHADSPLCVVLTLPSLINRFLKFCCVL
jgi:hypothetical protein